MKKKNIKKNITIDEEEQQKIKKQMKRKKYVKIM